MLEQIVARTRADVELRRARVPLEQLGPEQLGPEQLGLERLGPEQLGPERLGGARGPAKPEANRRPFSQALSLDGISLIAEHKRRSPSAGLLREGSTVTEIVTAYQRGGARALSILTEEHHFGGSLDDLREARSASRLPVLRKDFIVDTYQLHEAAAAGADAILLIVAALDRTGLIDLTAEAQELGLEVLVEVHDRAELDAALAAKPEVVGINNRDLADFSVDVGRTFSLLPAIPAGQLVISESGLHSRDQLERLQDAGVSGALIGETLMRAADPEAAAQALLR